MTAKIITVINQKGGAGKTTTTMQVGGTLGLRGYKVLIVDADPQGTASRWSSMADDLAPFPASVINLAHSGIKIHTEIRKHTDDYDFIIVDCPPAITSGVAQSTLLVSDMAVIPVDPAPVDLWATEGAKELIDLAKEVNTTLKVLLVVNKSRSTNLSQEVIERFKDFNCPIAKAILCDRNAYRESCIYGMTVHFLKSKAAKAICEVDALTDEITKMIGIKKSKKNLHNGGKK